MRGSRKFCQRGSDFFYFIFVYLFLFTISVPFLARQRDVIEIVFHRRADDGPAFNAGLNW